VPLYEYILQSDDPTRPDEVRVSDRAGLRRGDTLTVANRRWKVHSVEPPSRWTDPTRGRIVLVRDDSALFNREREADTGRSSPWPVSAR